MSKRFLLLCLFLILSGLSSYLYLDYALHKPQKITTFTAFFAYPADPISENNDIKKLIAQKTGVQIDMLWLNGQTVTDKVAQMIASQNYPDFIDGASATSNLVAARAFVPLEDYLPLFPNLYNYLSEKEWERLKDKDGHIYFIPQFGIVQLKDADTNHREEAFWIQKGVLEWAGYPKIKTLDEYFDVIAKYKAAHPLLDGQPTIGFSILCDDWHGFSLHNPPQFLAGYPNDGCAIVDPTTHEAKLYAFIPEAHDYYKKLNACYHQGLIDPNTFVWRYEDYLEHIASGRILGMVDQYWQFEKAQKSLYSECKYSQTYVPLGLTIDPNVQSHYRSIEALDVSNGIGISVDCKDIKGALGFMDALLTPELMTLRYWGIEGVDYEVLKDGSFFRTSLKQAQAQNLDYISKHFCPYNYFPHYDGMLADGINTVLPDNNQKKYFQSLSPYDQNFLTQYHYATFVDFLDPPELENQPWFPLYSFTNTQDDYSFIGRQTKTINNLYKKWLPQLIMCPEKDFETMWHDYKEDFYEQVDVDQYEALLTAEVEKRSHL